MVKYHMNKKRNSSQNSQQCSLQLASNQFSSLNATYKKWHYFCWVIWQAARFTCWYDSFPSTSHPTSQTGPDSGYTLYPKFYISNSEQTNQLTICWQARVRITITWLQSWHWPWTSSHMAVRGNTTLPCQSWACIIPIIPRHNRL